MTRNPLCAAIFPGRALFQLGYVTNDLERATTNFGRRYGVEKFFRYDGMQAMVGKDRTATLSVALAYVGDTQIELIHPQGGDDSVYRDALPADRYTVALHHLGYRIEDEAGWQAMLEAVARTGDRIVLHGQARTSRYLYTDSRAELGHYIEYLMFTPEGVENIACNFPRN